MVMFLFNEIQKQKRIRDTVQKSPQHSERSTEVSTGRRRRMLNMEVMKMRAEEQEEIYKCG